MNTILPKHTIIDYEKIYGICKPIEEVKNLIKGISSETILNIVAFFNVKLYLNDMGPDAHNIQLQLVNNLLNRVDNETNENFRKAFKVENDNGLAPTMIWRHSNLLFYEQIFSNYNNLPNRELTQTEAKNILDAYLIINSETGRRLKIETQHQQSDERSQERNGWLLPSHISPNGDKTEMNFATQVIRGYSFFKYLESSDKFSNYLKKYYEHLNIKDYREIYFIILNIFAHARIEEDINNRTQIIDIRGLIEVVNLKFIAALTINRFIAGYKTDNLFTILKEHMIFEIQGHPFMCLLLDIESLVNQLLTTQLLNFNNFLRENNYKENFIYIVSKEFMLDNYFKTIMKRCFDIAGSNPKDILSPIGTKMELPDFYFNIQNKIALIEFRDGPIENMTGEEDSSINQNRTYFNKLVNDPGGTIRQKEVIGGIIKGVISVDLPKQDCKIEIFPIVVYTNQSLGYEKVNKDLNKMFRKDIDNFKSVKINVNGLTLINLSFFETYEEYIKQDEAIIFEMLEEYHRKSLSDNSFNSSFDVFSRTYIKDHNKKELNNPPLVLQVMKEVFPQLQDN